MTHLPTYLPAYHVYQSAYSNTYVEVRGQLVALSSLLQRIELGLVACWAILVALEAFLDSYVYSKNDGSVFVLELGKA